jgi:FKBP-type peptidyl-prolyl cis-trans isomerase
MKNPRLTDLVLFSLWILSACKPGSTDNADNLQDNREKLVEINRILVEKDAQKIASFAERHGWDMNETQTGLWYMIYHRGKGMKAQTGMLATIEYKISLLDGTDCYDSDRSGPRQFKIGQGGVESGLEEGILFMHEGDKARFIMPPHLAHGLLGDNDMIPARAIIIYEVELIKLNTI